MADVVVPGTAGEPEPAGHRQRPARIVEGQAELARGDLHGAREARVQVDVGDVIDADPGERQGPLPAMRMAGDDRRS